LSVILAPAGGFLRLRTIMTYSEKMKDPRWQRKRLEVFERDRWICQKCSSGKDSLTVHHLCYLQGVEPWDHPMELLLTLCERCHDLESKKTSYEKLQSLSFAVLQALRSKTEERISKRYSKRTSRFLDCLIYLLEHSHGK
jgi:hypothetical protein